MDDQASSASVAQTPQQPQTVPSVDDSSFVQPPGPTVPPQIANSVIAQTATISPQPVASSGRTKEAIGGSDEKTPFIDVVGSDAIELEPLPPEVEKWMEKVNRGEESPQLQEVVIADKNTSVSTGTFARQPVFVLPLGEEELKTGQHASINDSIRWLATWCSRMIKKLGPTVLFHQ